MVESIVLTNEAVNASLLISQDINDFVLSSVDWGSVQTTRRTYKFIDQVGVLVTGVTFESRDASIVGWIVARTQADMTKRKKLLNRFVNPLHKIKLVYDEFYIEGIANSSVLYGTEEKENNDVMCKFMVDLFCPDPMFRHAIENNMTVADWAPKFHFPLIIPENKGIIMGLRMSSTIFAIENDGDTDCGFVVVFQAIGSVTNPFIVLIDTQETIKLNVEMQAGEIIEVSTVQNKKTITKITGEIKENVFNSFDFKTSKLFKFRTGTNNIKFGADANSENLLVNIRYSPEYLEVQK